ncbi:MAG: SurA N-terminal domain-containing protein, partial [Riemerella sp.]|nr:SurA N-terminal domain-containing protein [Riemerella sp.]
MSVIGQIRKKPWVLMGVVVIALLAFLINPDSLNKIFGKDPNILGKVNGEEITREEYSDALLMLQSQAEQQGRPTTGLEEQAWQNLVQSKLIKQEFEKLGLKITEDYFWSQLPYDPLFGQNPEFNVQEFKKEIEKARTDGNMIEQYNAWLRARKEIEYRMMARQVFGNITAGITSNKKEAETIMKQRDEVADI